jgi:hypothetical protein
MKRLNCVTPLGGVTYAVEVRKTGMRKAIEMAVPSERQLISDTQLKVRGHEVNVDVHLPR